MLLRVLSLLGSIIFRKAPSTVSVYPFIHVDVAGKEVSGISCCDALMNIHTVLSGNVEKFSNHIQDLSDPLEYSISVILSYFHTYVK